MNQDEIDQLRSMHAGGMLFVLLLVPYVIWRWRNRSWLRILYREVDGPCCMNAHVYAWIRHHGKTGGFA